MAIGEHLEPVPPDRALPVVLEMRKPGRNSDEWASRSMDGVAESRSVRGGAEADLLLHGRTVSRPLPHGKHPHADRADRERDSRLRTVLIRAVSPVFFLRGCQR